MKRLFIALISSFCLNSALGETAALSQTQNKLKQLETKIGHLQHTLDTAHHQNDTLTQQLSMTEKKISQSILQLRTVKQQNDAKQQQIITLQQQAQQLNQQLHLQQQALAKHLRIRYMMGEYQSLKWLLNQDAPTTSSRLLTFHQYIIRSRQRLMDKLQDTQKKLQINQCHLRQEMHQQQLLQQQLNQQQLTLAKNKRDNTVILNALQEDIQHQQQTLKAYQQDKNNLSQLLTSLTQQSLVKTQLKTQRPLLFAHQKLPRPIRTQTNLQKLNQGIVFLTQEGTPVIAISAGKVVFSDWLKGYGLLLIVDHGRGFMTLYAHNQSLFKKTGENVGQGEQIATVGHSGGIKQNGLYFEIRERGKAIPPLKWLS